MRNQTPIVLLLVASLLTGCVTVTGTSRGPFLSREVIADDPRGARPIAQVENGRAHVVLPSEQCRTYRDLYREIEHQEVTHPNYGLLFGGLALGAAGGAGLKYGLDNWDPNKTGGSNWALVLGGPAALVGLVMFLNGFRTETTYRKEPGDGTVPEYEHKCVDTSSVAREPANWTVAYGGAKRTGQTGPDGELALVPAMLPLLETQPAEPTARQLARGESLLFDVWLGQASWPFTYSLSGSDVPESQWARWSAEYDRTLAGRDLLQWNGCRAVTSSHGSAIDCLVRPERYGNSIATFDGSLARTEAGDYGALFERKGTRGEAFTFRVLLPESNADWLVQVVDLETGSVLLERFSGPSNRLDISGVFQRSSDYAFVLNAEKAGSFRSIFTVKR